MNQSKIESRIEIGCNYLSGFLIAWLTWTCLVWGPISWEWIDIHDGFVITMVFTVVSIMRSYFWRRFFTNGLHKTIHKLVKEWAGW